MRHLCLVCLWMMLAPAMRAEEVSDHDMQLTMIMISAYEDLLNGRDAEATARLKDATLRGHATAPLVLSELAWTDLAGEDRRKEALRWAQAAKANGAGEADALLAALASGNDNDVTAFFTKLPVAESDAAVDLLATVSSPVETDGGEDKRETKTNLPGWMAPLKTTTLQVNSSRAGIVLIDGIIAGSANEVLDVEPGSRLVEFMLSETEAQKISVEAIAGRSLLVNMDRAPAH